MQVKEERKSEIRSEGNCKKRSTTSNCTQVLARGMSILDVSKKERRMVVFSVTQSFTLNEHELFGICCAHELNPMSGKCHIYIMIATWEFPLFIVLFVQLFISDWS